MVALFAALPAETHDYFLTNIGKLRVFLQQALEFKPRPRMFIVVLQYWFFTGRSIF